MDRHLHPLLNNPCRVALGMLEVYERDDYDSVKDILLKQDPNACTSATHAW